MNKQNPQNQLAHSTSIDFSQLVTRDYLDAKLDVYTLIAYMPNKEDYVTRKEFDEFRMEFRQLQDLVLQLYGLVNTELVIRNRQFEAQFNRHEKALIQGGLHSGS